MSVVSGGGGEGEEVKKGLEGVGIPLPVNFHGNLRSAQNDQHLKEILHQANEAKQTASSLSVSLSLCHCKQNLFERSLKRFVLSACAGNCHLWS